MKRRGLASLGSLLKVPCLGIRRSFAPFPRSPSSTGLTRTVARARTHPFQVVDALPRGGGHRMGRKMCAGPCSSLRLGVGAISRLRHAILLGPGSASIFPVHDQETRRNWRTKAGHRSRTRNLGRISVLSPPAKLCRSLEGSERQTTVEVRLWASISACFSNLPLIPAATSSGSNGRTPTHSDPSLPRSSPQAIPRTPPPPQLPVEDCPPASHGRLRARTEMYCNKHSTVRFVCALTFAPLLRKSRPRDGTRVSRRPEEGRAPTPAIPHSFDRTKKVLGRRRVALFGTGSDHR